jgi:hypothetical protein
MDREKRKEKNKEQVRRWLNFVRQYEDEVWGQEHKEFIENHLKNLPNRMARESLNRRYGRFGKRREEGDE